jgi:transcriptional regulator with GAF, ATPase, and Fis domain
MLRENLVADSSESMDAELTRLRRLARVEDLAPTLFATLDMHVLLRQVSAIAKGVLPHDLVRLITLSDDRAMGTVYASAGTDRDSEHIVHNHGLAALTDRCDFHISDDLEAQPADLPGDAAPPGIRSVMRLPIRLQGELIGGIDFMSSQRAAYHSADLAIGRRIADYTALALSHRRLADENRRTANLERLDGLLGTLTGVLDVRDVFTRVSEIASQVIPHDAIALPVVTDDPEHAVTFATAGVPATAYPPVHRISEANRRLLVEPWEFEICDDLQKSPELDQESSDLGYRSALRVPIRLEGQLAACLVFFSRTPKVYQRSDALVARRIADHIALALSHQRLAEQARHAAELRSRTATLELLDDLLTSLIDTGDLPDVFDRVSAIARKVLHHDMLLLAVTMPDGRHVKNYASSGEGANAFSDVWEIPAPIIDNPHWEDEICDDLSVHPIWRHMDGAKRGYRSALHVMIRVEDELVASLVFLAFAPAAYKEGDLLVARRIRDRIALHLTKGRGAEAARRATEATARASLLEARVRSLTEELNARAGYRRIVGDSPSWRQALTLATQVANTQTTVLLLGESGTGKEVVARFIHGASAQSRGPFIALNCAALPEQLLEAELFGYERGAFTGATQSTPGQLEMAAGGLLFLDEVAEMSLSAQAKFLRVLQEREFLRLGGTRVLKTDARVVAASNRDLQRAIGHGQFREDLYYRLNVFAIHLPPLRDRRDDVLPLSEAFIEEIGRSFGRPPAGISREAQRALTDYHWPGNVRELRNVLERAAILCDGGLIAAEHLALHPSSTRPLPSETTPNAAAASPSAGEPGDLKSVERAMILKALKEARFNKSKAAKALGLTRAQLYRRLSRHTLE